jgi:hypothetical protein
MSCSLCKLVLVAAMLTPMSALAQGGGSAGGAGGGSVGGTSSGGAAARSHFTSGRARRRFGGSKLGARGTWTGQCWKLRQRFERRRKRSEAGQYARYKLRWNG